MGSIRAADTEHNWPWYGALLGGDAWFRSHPAIQTAELAVEDGTHRSTAHLRARVLFHDEWYNFQNNPRQSVTVLITIDENTYDPGPDRMGDHPIAWYHEVDEGRAWYTNLGHRRETYADEAFQEHVLGALLWAAGCEDGCATLPTPSPTMTPAPCPGDCDADGVVQVEELVTAVNVVLGVQVLASCSAADVDRDGSVTVAELIKSVERALNGC